MSYVDEVYERVVAQNPAQPEFHQAVREVLDSLRPVIRKLPDSRSEEIQSAANGETLTVLAVHADGWIQVVYQNETGYTRAGATTSRLAY